MKRLYEVTFELVTVAYAESEVEAVKVAEDDLEENRHNIEGSARPFRQYPKEWQNCIPWGEENDRTCGQIAAAEPEALK